MMEIILEVWPETFYVEAKRNNNKLHEHNVPTNKRTRKTATTLANKRAKKSYANPTHLDTLLSYFHEKTFSLNDFIFTIRLSNPDP